MKTWFVKYSGPSVGTDMYELHEAETEAQVYDDFEQTAYEHYEQWLSDDDYDENGDLLVEIETDITVEEYNPKEHNGYLDSSNKLYIPD